MSYTFRNNPDLATVNKNWGFFMVWGIALILLGLLAIAASTLTTVVSVIFLGILIFVGGIFIAIDAFKYWGQGWGTFLLHLLIGILYLIAGITLFANPVSGAVSLTLILAIFYVVLGLFRIVGSISVQQPQWGWVLFNGIIALVLGVLILAHWPDSSLFIIGLFVGIDLLVCGLAYVMLTLSARAFTSNTPKV